MYVSQQYIDADGWRRRLQHNHTYSYIAPCTMAMYDPRKIDLDTDSGGDFLTVFRMDIYIQYSDI